MDEIQSFQSKSQSLRDKMKARRQAIESLVASATAGVHVTEGRPAAAASLVNPEEAADGRPPAKVACQSDLRTDRLRGDGVNGTKAADRHERTRGGGGEKGKPKKEVDELMQELFEAYEIDKEENNMAKKHRRKDYLVS